MGRNWCETPGDIEKFMRANIFYVLKEKIQPNLEPFENQLEDIQVDGKYLPLKKVVEADLHSNIDVAYGSVVELIDFTMDVDTMVHQSGGKEV